jgi:hypothetical protein
MMMHMPWVLVSLIIFLIVVAGAAFLAVRTMAASTAKNDHPH